MDCLLFIGSERGGGVDVVVKKAEGVATSAEGEAEVEADKTSGVSAATNLVAAEDLGMVVVVEVGVGVRGGAEVGVDVGARVGEKLEVGIDVDVGVGVGVVSEMVTVSSFDSPADEPEVEEPV